MKTRTIEISTANRAESIVLPINPEKIQVKSGQKNQTIDLLELGEVMSLGNRKLSSLSISSFFPSKKSALFRYANREPWDYYNTFDRWRLDKNVVRIIIGGSQVNMAAAIDDLSFEIREGDEDLYFTLDLSEYRKLNVPMVQDNSFWQDNGLLDRPDTYKKPDSIVVTSPEETFWYIACKYYGDGTKWKMIATANGKELAYDTRVGDRVVLP